jgi:glycosyltransferase involved in cell wall biosynthesis
MLKVVLLTNMIAPYRVPVFNILHMNKKYNFKIGFLLAREANREWLVRSKDLNVPFEILQGWHKFSKRFDITFQMNFSVLRFLIKETPDIIIVGGYIYPAYWLARFYARLNRRKYIIWSGSTLQSSKVAAKAVNKLRLCFYKDAAAFVAYSTQAARFIEAHGGKKESIFIGYNCGDTDYYREEVMRYDRIADCTDRLVFLFVGQLIPRKGLDLAITVLSTLQYRNWQLLIVGSGPEKDKLLNKVNSMGMSDNVEFLGFLEREKLAKIYAMSDVFLFPTLRDPGAIVISEALASGLFTLASKYDGIAPDLIEDGVNGYTFDPLNQNEFSNILLKTSQRFRENRIDRQQIVSSIAQYSPKNYAEAFIEAIEYSLREN